jgi:hypothetical protein
MPEPGAFDSQMAIEKFKVYQSLGLDEILTELVQLGDKRLCSEILTFYSIWNKENFLNGRQSL